MEKNSVRWEVLLKSVRGTLSSEEEIIFQKWLTRDIRHKAYYEKMCRVWSSDNTTYDLHTDVAEMIVRFDDYVRNKRKARHRKILRNIYRSVACLLILLTVGGGLMLLKKDKQEIETANRIAGSILPGQGKAIILLPNGEKIDIALLSDSLSYRTAGFTVEKDSGIIRYMKQQQAQTDYHTIVIPIGGEYQVKLSDGTMVWLNSDSRLKIPTAFVGNERRVFLSGEAYFDVVKNDRKPFIVETDLGNIKVYGTEFNVKRYSGDRQLQATLVEGSIGFSNDQVAELKLQPGYQLSLIEGISEPTVEKVKVYNEIAWKDQRFCFENRTLESIVRDMERWYNVKIVFEDPVLKQLQFSGSLSRYGEIETLLHFFEESADITFEVDNHTITVKKIKK